MKTPIIVLVIALACYTLANLINGRIESVDIAPLTAAIFAAIGAFGALSISHGMK
jgi:hypothetical protein